MEIRTYSGFREAEIADLYASVGWTAYTADLPALRRGFEKSLLVLAAYDNERLIGILRAVGDGETIVFVQDLLVHPAYRRKGVGSALVRTVLERYASVRQIELVTDNTPDTVAFYRSMGFKSLDEIGCRGFMRC